MTVYETEPIPHKGPSAEHLHLDRDRLRRFAKLMDTQFSIGSVQFGIDSIVGLLPGVGDVVSTAINLYPIHLAHKHRLPKHVQLHMLGNVVLDLLIGIVPILGDVGDVFYKAARKNADLFEKHAARKDDV